MKHYMPQFRIRSSSGNGERTSVAANEINFNEALRIVVEISHFSGAELLLNFYEIERPFYRKSLLHHISRFSFRFCDCRHTT